MQEPSPGHTTLSSCLPALNSSSKTLPALLAHPLCGLIHFLPVVDMLSISHLHVCWLLGPAGLGRGSMMSHGDGNLMLRKSTALVRKGAPAQDDILPPRPALPCSYIIPASVHTFRLVLSIIFHYIIISITTFIHYFPVTTSTTPSSKNYHLIFWRHNFAWTRHLCVSLCAFSEPTGQPQANLVGGKRSQNDCIISHIGGEGLS